jgi:regulator of RNase E activity RraA
MLRACLDRVHGESRRWRWSWRARGAGILTLGLVVWSCLPGSARAQTISKEQLIFLTEEWEGERFPDGRPKVPDRILERMKKVSIEEAWEVLRGAGYRNQFEGGWKMIHPDRAIVGRALTAVYMPARPELQKRMVARGHREGRIGGMNSWPIDALTKGDVYVADGFGKIVDGTLIGDNLGNAIYAKSGNGVVFDGSVRDLEGLQEIDGFNAFVRGWDPSSIQEMMLIGLNVPARIGRAAVLPGDVVLAKREGVIFIPAHLAARVVERAEVVMLRDQFGHQRLREGKYTPGQIDSSWSDEIEKDFTQWLKDHQNDPEVPRETVQDLLKKRSN